MAGEEGWAYRIPPIADGFFHVYGDTLFRTEADGRVRARFMTRPDHANQAGVAHGGYLLALVDTAMFIGAGARGVDVAGAVTVDCSAQFLGAVRIGAAVDAVVELLRETRRLVFVRGLLEQDGEPCLAFSGTLRKGGGGR